MQSIRPEKFLTLVFDGEKLVTFVVPPKLELPDSHEVVGLNADVDDETGEVTKASWQKAIEYSAINGKKMTEEQLEDMLQFTEADSRDAIEAAVRGAGVVSESAA